ncbi:MAG: putative bifunctional diguanylate cyclase/phosphodiesterase, partial [Thiohalomonadaceae bacterium]
RRLADSVFTRSSEGIVIADAQGHVLQVNPAFQQLTGMKTADLRGQSLAAIGARTADGDDLAMVMDALAREGRWEGEIWHQRAGGRVNPLWLSAAAVLDTTGNVEHYTAIFIDLGALKDAEKRIHHLAYFDSLTNLPNRMLFQDRLHQALTQAQRHGELVGVLLIDLDRFKVINDTKGHAFGDLLLRHVAQRLRGALREEDTVARLGGDEFAVIVPGLRDAEDATLVAQKVLGLFGPAFAIDGEEFYTAASIGLSLFPVDAREAEMLIANADAALFRAKEHGRSVYRFFTPDMNDRVAEVMEIEHGLRQAIERNELTLCYQPQFDLRSGAPVGVEALLRWKSRRLGHVPPALFIPVAEECGLIGVIGEWMLREACRQASDWRRRGLAPVRMAVNLSARQFSDPRLLAQIEHALAASDLDPEALEVEITESVVMTDLDRSIATLMRLNELGVRIAVDDFGTGYSSLSYLKRFPLHALKIDRSFIRDVMEDADDAAITGAIIHMGHSLGLTVIAEGVENPGHESFLRAHDCDLAQGYFYGRAVSACEVEKLLSRRALPAAVC